MKNNLSTCMRIQKIGLFLSGGVLGLLCGWGLARREDVPKPLSYESEFEASLPYLESLFGINHDNQEQIQELFEQFVNMRASLEWLETNGGIQDVSLQHALRKVAYEHLVRQLVDESVRIQEVSSGDIETYYQENESLFDIPARFRGFYLVWNPEDPLAETLGEKIQTSTTMAEWESLMEEFGDLWVEDSNTGMIPSMYARDWREHICPVPPELADTLHATEGTSVFIGPVVIDDLAHGFFVLSRQNPVKVPLRNVRTQLQRDIYRQRWDRKFKEVMLEIAPNPRPSLQQEQLARIMETTEESRLARESDQIPVFRPDM